VTKRMSFFNQMIAILMAIPWFLVISVVSISLLATMFLMGREMATLTWAKLRGKPVAIIQNQSGSITISTAKYVPETNPPHIKINNEKFAVTSDSVYTLGGTRAFYIYPELSAAINPEAARKAGVAKQLKNALDFDLNDLQDVVSWNPENVLSLAPYNIRPDFVNSVEEHAKNKSKFGKMDIARVATLIVFVMMGSAVALYLINIALQTGGGGVSLPM